MESKLLVNTDDLALGFIELNNELNKISEIYPNNREILMEIEYYISKLEKTLYEKAELQE